MSLVRAVVLLLLLSLVNCRWIAASGAHEYPFILWELTEDGEAILLKDFYDSDGIFHVASIAYIPSENGIKFIANDFDGSLVGFVDLNDLTLTVETIVNFTASDMTYNQETGEFFVWVDSGIDDVYVTLDFESFEVFEKDESTAKAGIAIDEDIVYVKSEQNLFVWTPGNDGFDFSLYLTFSDSEYENENLLEYHKIDELFYSGVRVRSSDFYPCGEIKVIRGKRPDLNCGPYAISGGYASTYPFSPEEFANNFENDEVFLLTSFSKPDGEESLVVSEIRYYDAPAISAIVWADSSVIIESSSPGYVFDSITFDVAVPGNPLKLEFNYGDESQYIATEEPFNEIPDHRYLTAGEYEVKVVVTYEQFTKEFSTYVEIIEVTCPEIGGFNVSPLSASYFNGELLRVPVAQVIEFDKMTLSSESLGDWQVSLVVSYADVLPSQSVELSETETPNVYSFQLPPIDLNDEHVFDMTLTANYYTCSIVSKQKISSFEYAAPVFESQLLPLTEVVYVGVPFDLADITIFDQTAPDTSPTTIMTFGDGKGNVTLEIKEINFPLFEFAVPFHTYEEPGTYVIEAISVAPEPNSQQGLATPIEVTVSHRTPELVSFEIATSSPYFTGADILLSIAIDGSEPSYFVKVNWGAGEATQEFLSQPSEGGDALSIVAIFQYDSPGEKVITFELWDVEKSQLYVTDSTTIIIEELLETLVDVEIAAGSESNPSQTGATVIERVDLVVLVGETEGGQGVTEVATETIVISNKNEFPISLVILLLDSKRQTTGQFVMQNDCNEVLLPTEKCTVNLFYAPFDDTPIEEQATLLIIANGVENRVIIDAEILSLEQGEDIPEEIVNTMTGDMVEMISQDAINEADENLQKVIDAYTVGQLTSGELVSIDTDSLLTPEGYLKLDTERATVAGAPSTLLFKEPSPSFELNVAAQALDMAIISVTYVRPSGLSVINVRGQQSDLGVIEDTETGVQIVSFSNTFLGAILKAQFALFPTETKVFFRDVPVTVPAGGLKMTLAMNNIGIPDNADVCVQVDGGISGIVENVVYHPKKANSQKVDVHTDNGIVTFFYLTIADIDGQIRDIDASFDAATTSFNFCFPHFRKFVLYDPNFSVLVAGNGGGVSSDSFYFWKTTDGILTFVSVGLAALAVIIIIVVGAIYEARKKAKRIRRENRQLSEISSSMRESTV